LAEEMDGYRMKGKDEKRDRKDDSVDKDTRR
jgi:hypothetical protein